MRYTVNDAEKTSNYKEALYVKTEVFFDDLKCKDNVFILQPKDNIVNIFCEEFNMYQDKFFYEQFICSGGIIIDNWIRIYGCLD